MNDRKPFTQEYKSHGYDLKTHERQWGTTFAMTPYEAKVINTS